uniref:Uncharacterized protein n=1 Tax=Glossina austeni TaxID=7395 RepID=A0A1A9USE1_GLOAU
MGTHSSAATWVGDPPSISCSLGSLSNDGSLLNISTGTVAGALSAIISIIGRLDNCRSTLRRTEAAFNFISIFKHANNPSRMVYHQDRNVLKAHHKAKEMVGKASQIK